MCSTTPICGCRRGPRTFWCLHMERSTTSTTISTVCRKRNRIPQVRYPNRASSPPLESRINLTRRAHDDGRLRGWAGTPSTAFGPGWDKGHFIAHAIGGAVDGVEANVFLQRRSINRGGYRRMEQYCAEHAGVLCFSRPLYDDLTSRPAAVEFGVLKPEMTWWVQRFSNR